MVANSGRSGADVGAHASRDFALTGVLTAAVYLATFLFYVRGFQGYTRHAREVFIWLAVLPLLYLFRRGYRLVREPGGERHARARSSGSRPSSASPARSSTPSTRPTSSATSTEAGSRFITR